jgi:hypothetical protein
MAKFNKYTITNGLEIDKSKGYLILIIKNFNYELINSFTSIKFCYYYFKKLKNEILQNEI